MKYIKKYLFNWFTATVTVALVLFWPSFTTFFTNDDFYFLNISRATNLIEFFQFFDPVNIYKGQQMYRPLTTQAFYYLGNTLFYKNPVLMHLSSFSFFVILIYLVYLLSLKLFKNKQASILLTFLYATSATHFSHLYYLATFQEIGVAVFIFLSLLLFLKKKYLFSMAAFILGLLSKETAVIIPLLLLLIQFYNRELKIKKVIPFVVILGIYLAIRLKFYNFSIGDSYIWDFSTKIFNTHFWYGVWSLNIPESFIDFIGPGFYVNSNLFVYWKHVAVLSMGIFLSLIMVLMIRIRKLKFKFLLFNVLFFILGLLPVLFLPFHKFTYVLTVPLFAVVSVVSFSIFKSQKLVIVVILLWLIGSVVTLKHTKDTHWITNGAKTAMNVKRYLDRKSMRGEINFVDTDGDKTLPWSPTMVLTNAISGQDFFDVYYPGKIKLSIEGIKIESRQFLGY